MTKSDIKYKLDEQQLILVIPLSELPEFNKLLNRALNCYPEAGPERKSLCDIIQHGGPLVNYYDQEESTRMRYTQTK